jgi:hypothetical protein
VVSPNSLSLSPSTSSAVKTRKHGRGPLDPYDPASADGDIKMEYSYE